jgi:hypothetical protein
MPSNQNPVFTDNETITGDGTVQSPLIANTAQVAASIPSMLVFQTGAPVAVAGNGSTVPIFDETIDIPEFPVGNPKLEMLSCFEFDAGAATGSLVVSIGLGTSLATYTKTFVSGEKAIISVMQTIDGSGSGSGFVLHVNVAYTSAEDGSVPTGANLSVKFFEG